MTDTPEYSIWTDIKKRCANPSHKYFSRYGGRGITICDRWVSDFSAFYADMGPRPSPTHQIDRINNDGGYEPNNCRWATKRNNMLNTGRAMLADFNGERLPIRIIADITGVKYGTLYYRFKRGRPILTEKEQGAAYRPPPVS